MKLKIFKDATLANKYLASVVATAIKLDQPTNIGLSIEPKLHPFYSKLVGYYNSKKVDFSNSYFFNLQEYYPIDEQHSKSYHFAMNTHFFDHVNASSDHIFYPDQDHEYDFLIKDHGGLDLIVLTTNNHGYLGFNLPNSPHDTISKIVSLTPEMLKDHAEFFINTDQVPKEGQTMGLKTINQAKKVFLLFLGTGTKLIFKEFLSAKKFNPQLPVTLLKNHSNLEVIVDRNCYQGYLRARLINFKDKLKNQNSLA